MDLANTKTILKSSYERPDVAAQRLSKSGYTLDTGLSSDDTKVFTDAAGKPHVAFRGTTLNKGLKTAIRDVGTDLMIGVGKTTNRERAAKRTVEAIRHKYPGQEVTSYGHSLGSKLAASSGADKSVVYNPAVGLRDIGRTRSKNETLIRTTGDFISLPSLTQRKRGKNITLNRSGHGLDALR